VVHEHATLSVEMRISLRVSFVAISPNDCGLLARDRNRLQSASGTTTAAKQYAEDVPGLVVRLVSCAETDLFRHKSWALACAIMMLSTI